MKKAEYIEWEGGGNAAMEAKAAIWRWPFGDLMASWMEESEGWRAGLFGTNTWMQ
jgi:hypothetical protein